MSDIHSVDVEDDQFAYRYDTQLLIDRRDEDLDEDVIADYITEHFEGNCLIAAGDEDLIKIHFHTNEPWKVLEYCSTIGEIYDIVVEDDSSVSWTSWLINCRSSLSCLSEINRWSSINCLYKAGFDVIPIGSRIDDRFIG